MIVQAKENNMEDQLNQLFMSKNYVKLSIHSYNQSLPRQLCHSSTGTFATTPPGHRPSGVSAHLQLWSSTKCRIRPGGFPPSGFKLD